MPNGRDGILKLAGLCKELARCIAEMDREKRLADAKARLESLSLSLESISNKVFFKTKASIPLVSSCLGYAQRMEEAYRQWQEAPDADKAKAISAFLDGLEQFDREVSTLQSKVASQDIIVT